MKKEKRSLSLQDENNKSKLIKAEGRIGDTEMRLIEANEQRLRDKSSRAQPCPRHSFSFFFPFYISGMFYESLSSGHVFSG